MNAASQVLHLIRFALLRMRWWLAAYGVALLLAILAALNIAPTQGELASLTPFLLAVLGMLVAVITIQSDSPVRSQAFWRGQAVHAGLLLASKILLIVLLLIVLPLIATGAAVLSMNLPASEVLRMTWVAAPKLALWTTLAALSAACTRDAKSAAILMIGGAIASTLLADDHGIFPSAGRLRRIPWSWVFAASAVCMAVVYLRRLPIRAAIVMSLAIVIAGVSIIPGSPIARTVQSLEAPIPTTESLTIDDIDLTGSTRADHIPTLRLRVINALPNVRYDLGLAQMTAFLLNGDSINVTLNGTIGNKNMSDVIALPTGMQWRVPQNAASSREGTLTLPINWQQERPARVRRFAKGDDQHNTEVSAQNNGPVAGDGIRDEAVVRVNVRAVLDRHVTDELIAGPFSTAEKLTSPGQRLLLRERVDSVGRKRLIAEWLAVGDPSRYQTVDGDPYIKSPYVFVLQNATRGEAAMLNVRARDGLANSFVLPGVDRRFYRFDVAGAAAVDTTLDPAWLRESTVRMLRWRRLAGSARISAERKLPQ